MNILLRIVLLTGLVIAAVVFGAIAAVLFTVITIVVLAAISLHAIYDWLCKMFVTFFRTKTPTKFPLMDLSRN